MVRKSFKIETEINLKMVCVPGIRICKYDHVYVNLELFGETQKSKLLHPIFPIVTKDIFYFEKMFWSPQNMKEVHKLLKESPVSIELRRLEADSRESLLLAYADSNAQTFLISDGDRQGDVITGEKQIDLVSTEHHCGPSPRVKVFVKSKITSTETPIMDELLHCDCYPCPCCHQFQLQRSQISRGGTTLSSTGDMFSCNCELHRTDSDETIHCRVCHQDRKVAMCAGCQWKLKKLSNEQLDINTEIEDKDEHNPGKFRPPFVVRKVPSNIVARMPDAYDSVFNQTLNEYRKKKSSKTKSLHRLRSKSPKRDLERSQSSSKVCYACTLSPNEVRISCDACNLTHCGEPSFRSYDLVRPEPPLLTTFREPTEQRPLYPLLDRKCPKCMVHCKSSLRNSYDNSLMVSSRSLHKLKGY